jgi:hypothetical protein
MNYTDTMADMCALLIRFSAVSTANQIRTY